MVKAVQLKIACTQLQAGFPLAPQQGPATGPEFVQAEWLGHQVVGPKIEATNPRLDLLAGGQHQHREFVVQKSDLFKNLFSILEGQVEIENRQIRSFLTKCLDCSRSIAGHTYAMPIGLEAAAQKQSQRLIVFGDQ